MDGTATEERVAHFLETQNQKNEFFERISSRELFKDHSFATCNLFTFWSSKSL